MTAGDGKRVGFLELFFDLVFVFAVTQLVGALHDDHAAAGWGRMGLLLWLVWWAWSQFAWTGNAIDMDRRPVRVIVLVASFAMLLAAIALPDAFADRGAWFALPYLGVRAAGLHVLGVKMVPTAMPPEQTIFAMVQNHTIRISWKAELRAPLERKIGFWPLMIVVGGLLTTLVALFLVGPIKGRPFAARISACNCIRMTPGLSSPTRTARQPIAGFGSSGGFM